MKMNPINLAVRFILEMIVLIVMGIWGWNFGNGALQFVLALGVPIAAATTWGVFNVLDDPSRSGKAPVVVSGIVRLIIELGFFATAVWMLHSLGYSTFALGFAITVIIHYIFSGNRIKWLLKN